MRKLIALVAGAMMVVPTMAQNVTITDPANNAVIQVECTVQKSLSAVVTTDPVSLNLAATNPVAWEDAKDRAITVAANYDVTITATPGGDLFGDATDGITALVGLGAVGAVKNYATPEGTAATQTILENNGTVAAPAQTTVNIKASGTADTPANLGGKSGTVTITLSS